MDTSLSCDERTLKTGAEGYTTLYLLERALAYIRQERIAESVALLTVVREQLPASQAQLVAILDRFITGYADYEQAQYILQEASRQFAAVHVEQQGRVAQFAAALPAHICALHSASLSSDLPTEQQGQPPLQPYVTTARQVHHENSTLLPALNITCFGRFEVRRQGKHVNLCSSRNGQGILRYLVVKSEHGASSDTLQTLFWPDDEAEVAQNKLHIAISSLRRSLNHGYPCSPGGGYILCNNGVYQLNPAIPIHSDIDEFLRCYQSGRQKGEQRAQMFEQACNLYTGPFLVEDLYADWSFLQREQLSQIYLTMCRTLADHCFQHQNYEDAAKWAAAILKENRCDEAAHRHLMQVYLAQGRRNEALQQYQRCESILRQELGVALLPETTALFKSLL